MQPTPAEGATSATCCVDDRGATTAPRLRRAMLAATALLAAGCYQPFSAPQSEGHLTTQSVKPIPENVPPPAKTSTFVPPPKPTVKQPTFSVVVNEVPVKDLLFALARDSKQNIDVHPSLQGLVSLNAIDETLPAILDRIAKQVDIRYRVEGNTIVVSPDTPYFKVYRVNYINMTRDSTSQIGASGQLTTAGSSGGAAGSAAPATGGAPGGAGANSSTTFVRTTANTNFWEVLRENIRAILNSTRAQSLSSEDKTARAEAVRSAREERLAQVEAVSRAGAGAMQLFNTAFGGTPQAQLPGDMRDNIVVNPMAGTVNVLATEKQHQLIQQYLDGVTSSVQRQVLIEATIAEVTLSDQYQAGVDWKRLAGHGVKFNESFVSAGNFTPGSLQIGYSNADMAITIQLLSQFGRTRVLSSPKLMALNNQTSLLKVVDNFVYFQVEAQQGAITGGGIVQPPVFNTTAQSVAVGVVMAVTPQINEAGRVTLTIRPTITRVVGTVQDPNPSLRVTNLGITSTIKNEVPVIQAREMESVLQIGSGQTVILGGLMQDEVDRTRNYVPVLGNLPGIGELFGYRNDKTAKTELVIFLRPTVITNPSLDSDELAAFRRLLPGNQPEAEFMRPYSATPGLQLPQ